MSGRLEKHVEKAGKSVREDLRGGGVGRCAREMRSAEAGKKGMV